MKIKPPSTKGARAAMSSGTNAHAPTNHPTSAVALVVGDVACRAYQNFQKHGSADGHDVQDWLQAEAELSSELAMAGRD